MSTPSDIIRTPIPKSNAVPDNAVSFLMIFNNILEPKPLANPFKPDGSRKGNPPYTVFGVPIHDTRIPLENCTDDSRSWGIAGCHTSINMSMYNPPQGLIQGAIYTASGAYFTEYYGTQATKADKPAEGEQAPDAVEVTPPVKEYDGPLRSLRIAKLTLADLPRVEIMRQIPFEKRCIRPFMLPPTKDYMFFAADIDHRFPLLPSTLCGSFLLPAKNETSCFQCKLKKTNGVVDGISAGDERAQVLLNQTDAKGISKSYMLYTTMYGVSWAQTNKWKYLGFYFAKHMKGVLGVNIKMADTKAASVDPMNQSKIEAAIVGSCNFMPDLQYMIPAAGFEIEWETAVKLIPRLGDGKDLDPPTDVILDMRGMRAINLSRVKGNVTAMIEMPQYVKFYLVFDHRIRLDEKDEMIRPTLNSLEETKAWVMNKDNWESGTMNFEIYAVCTPECPTQIGSFVCGSGEGKRAGIHAVLMANAAPSDGDAAAPVADADTDAHNKRVHMSADTQTDGLTEEERIAAEMHQ